MGETNDEVNIAEMLTQHADAHCPINYNSQTQQSSTVHACGQHYADMLAPL